MSEVCAALHRLANGLPRVKPSDDTSVMPANGIYLVFEAGEKGHGANRIVRVGTHTGKDNLRNRIFEHVEKPNKDRSIFRKHIGRCILADDPFLQDWNIDLTSRKNKEKYAHRIDAVRQKAVEAQVTDYIGGKLEFVVIPIEDKAERLAHEKAILSTIASCDKCRPSPNWLGLKHPSERVRNGLWNIQGYGGGILTLQDVEHIASLLQPHP